MGLLRLRDYTGVMMKMKANNGMIDKALIQQKIPICSFGPTPLII